MRMVAEVVDRWEAVEAAVEVEVGLNPRHHSNGLHQPQNKPTDPHTCPAKIVNAVNNRFGTNFNTDSNVTNQFQFSTGAPPGQGTLNLNFSVSNRAAYPQADSRSIGGHTSLVLDLCSMYPADREERTVRKPCLSAQASSQLISILRILIIRSDSFFMWFSK